MGGGVAVDCGYKCSALLTRHLDSAPRMGTKNFLNSAVRQMFLEPREERSEGGWTHTSLLLATRLT